MKRRYHNTVTMASQDFDIHAKNYDTLFTNSSIGRAQRKRVYLFLSEMLASKSSLSVLELNCGTGEDAAYLSKKGHRVLATDISEEMIAQSKKKHPKINFKTLDIRSITSETFDDRFDIIFSNFGGFNCLSREELAAFLRVSKHLLNPKGKIILVIMPKNTAWERMYFLAKGSFKKAFRRKSTSAVQANVEGVHVPTWYYNPKDIVTLATDTLDLLTIKPIGITIPPSYLEPFFLKRQKMLDGLAKMESWFRSPFWAKYADHYFIAFQKK